MATVVDHWKFRPHPLLPSGHLQTLAGIYLPRRYAPYRAKQHFVPVDGPAHESGAEQIVLHEDRPTDWDPAKPVVLFIHGMTGSHLSSYMCRMAERMTERGHTVFRMDMRGCGAGMELARTPTHAGRAGDAAAAIEYIGRRYPDSPTLGVGFSIGGTLLLNMLAEAGSTPVGRLERVLSICPPIDMFAIERRFNTWLGRKYDKFFVRALWQQITERWSRFPELAPKGPLRRPTRVKQIDELIHAPAGGFNSADHYYQETQPGPKLAAIRQPATILAASDDPIVPTAPLLDYPRSKFVETVVVPSGGHLGFLAARNGDPDTRWLDWRIVDWIEKGR